MTDLTSIKERIEEIGAGLELLLRAVRDGDPKREMEVRVSDLISEVRQVHFALITSLSQNGDDAP